MLLTERSSLLIGVVCIPACIIFFPKELLSILLLSLCGVTSSGEPSLVQLPREQNVAYSPDGKVLILINGHFSMVPSL